MNGIRIIIKMLFPILVIPIVTTSLGPSKLGLVEYANSLVAYFVLLASLGIHSYGSREVAIHKYVITKFSKIILELLILLLITSSIAFILYELLIFYNQKFNEEFVLYTILGVQIFFTTALSAEWIYEGVENQHYITIRTLCVQVVSFCLILLFVKQPSDYIIYASILVFPFVVNCLLNVFYLKKNISLSGIVFQKLNPFYHLKAVTITFAAALATIIYTQCGIVIIGFFQDMENVGYYSIAVKFYKLFMGVLPAFSGVILPRLTSLAASENWDSYLLLSNRILSVIVMYAVFVTMILLSLSKPLLLLFASSSFTSSIFTLKILSLAVFGSALSYFYGIIILYSKRKDLKFLWICVFTALFNFLLNILVIQFYNYNGVAFVLVLSEWISFFILIFFNKKYFIGIKLLTFDNIKIIFSGIASYILVSFLLIYFNNSLVQVIIGLLVGGFIYVSMLFLFKNRLVVSSVNKFKFLIKK